MNIMSPLDRIEEIHLLAKVGAREFFCGYAPDYYIRKYNQIDRVKSAQISINKREAINMSENTFEKMKSMVEEAHRYECKLFVVMNSSNFPEDTYEGLKRYLDELRELKVDGIIVGDLGVVSYIKNYYPDFYIILSCVCHPENSLSTKLYEALGVNRLTFAHHMSLDEICQIVEDNPNMEYEVFVLEGRCIYDLGRCNALHGAGHFCRDNWQYEYFPVDGNEKSYGDLQKIYQNEMAYNRWTKPYMSISQQINGWKAVTCAMCAIPRFLDYKNIVALKIAGRGCNNAEKVTMVRTINRALKLAKNKDDVKLIKEYGKKVFGVSEMCDEKIRCLNI